MFFLISSISEDLQNPGISAYSPPSPLHAWYVEEEEDDEEFQEKMQRLVAELKQQVEEGTRLDEEIEKNMERIGFGF